MIEQLRIQHLGVIADATLELGPGFTAITGETGAGKTMVVTALGLLMGERSDAATVRSGADAARVGGVVHVSNNSLIERVIDAGGVVEEGELLLTRTVASEGRSRASVGGAAAPIALLSELAQSLFTVHGQSDQMRLRSGAEQREMLDRFGGTSLLNVRESFTTVFDEHRVLSEQLEQLIALRDDRAAEAIQLRAALEEIEAVDPQPGEEDQLKQQIERLNNSEELRSATAAALAAISNESDDPFGSDASQMIEAALRELERVSATDERLHTIADALRLASMQLTDTSRELARYANDLDQDGPAELAAANERLSQISQLLRNFGATTEEVIEFGKNAATRLSELENDDQEIERLQTRVAQLSEERTTLAHQLSELRTKAAAQLDSLVTAELQHLALPGAQLLTQVEQAQIGRHGADVVTLQLQPHPGAPARPLAKGASGGELSRVMLAIEVVIAESDPVPTFVFDEVDAGIGGAAAIEIGRRLARLAKTSQVIVVTHLAQVAAFANNHVTIIKDSNGGFTQSSCQRLEGKSRITEIARLLSGISDSESALSHAAELLEMGERSR